MDYQFERRKKGTAGVSRWFDGVEEESGMAGGSGKDGSGWREIWERVEINFIFQGCMESFVFKF